ncbi:Uncharacterised protein [Mycobacteroides abscessus subsp. massiliense]|nr:Uncharacterised protein [Mycobacteroides abscessus subsp. massiliense]
MALRKGDTWRGECGCEIVVTKSAPTDCTGNLAPTCCLGKPMTKVEDE